MSSSISPERQKIMMYYNNRDTKINLFKNVFKINQKRMSDICLRNTVNLSKVSKTLSSVFNSLKSLKEQKQKDIKNKALSLNKSKDIANKSQIRCASVKNRSKMLTQRSQEYIKIEPNIDIDKTFQTDRENKIDHFYISKLSQSENTRVDAKSTKTTNNLLFMRNNKVFQQHQSKYHEEVINSTEVMCDSKYQSDVVSTLNNFMHNCRINKPNKVFT